MKDRFDRGVIISESPFSEVLRNATWGDHESAESEGYLKALMAGRLSREAYGELVAQHYFAYSPSTASPGSLGRHPIAAPSFPRALPRGGAGPRPDHRVRRRPGATAIEPSKRPTPSSPGSSRSPTGRAATSPTTTPATWATCPGGSSSGWSCRRSTATSAGGGVDFYFFDEVGNLPRFKEEYRRPAGRPPPDEPDKQRVIRETKLAYQLNSEVLADLGRVVRAEIAA